MRLNSDFIRDLFNDANVSPEEQAKQIADNVLTVPAVQNTQERNYQSYQIALTKRYSFQCDNTFPKNRELCDSTAETAKER